MGDHRIGADLGGQALQIPDPGDANYIDVRRSGVCAFVSAAAETRYLRDPAEVGMILTLTLDTDGGDVVVTCQSAINVTGNNTITFADAGDTITLFSTTLAGAKVWRAVACIPEGDTPALSTV